MRPGWAADARLGEPAGYLDEAFERLLFVAGLDPSNEGLADTPHRAASAWRERINGYQRDPAHLFRTFDADGYDELVAIRDIPFYSTCEHHLEDIAGHAHVGYIAQGKIVGLSKLARLVDLYAHRLQVQERMTYQIADAIDTYLEPKGTIVVLSARHLCMERRGVRKPGATTITSVVRGALKDKPESRAEAMELLRP